MYAIKHTNYTINEYILAKFLKSFSKKSNNVFVHFIN